MDCARIVLQSSEFYPSRMQCSKFASTAPPRPIGSYTREQYLKLHLAKGESTNMVTGYGADFVAINGVMHRASLIVSADRILENWRPANFTDINSEDLRVLLNFAPSVVLLGTGATLRHLHPKELRPLVEAKIGYEIMDTAAACRTFNVLIAEGRAVVAALVVSAARISTTD